MKQLPKIPKNPVCHDMSDVNRLILIMVELRTYKKATEELLNTCANAVQAFMKEHEVTSVSTKETYASITKYSSTLFNKKQFQQEHPNMYKKYVTTQNRERFNYGLENNDNA